MIRTDPGERGQAAVLSALCLFTLIVFMALATNLGALASDRVRVQNTADAAALAGAYAQAGRLNQISQINANIAYTAWYCRRRLTRALGQVKVWKQCLYEPLGGDFPFDPPFGTGVDGPGQGFRPPVCHWAGGTPSGPMIDPDAEQLIDWCRQTMQGYRTQIAAIANWSTNYRPPTPVSPGGGVRRAAYLTADRNFFKSNSEMVAHQRTYIYERIGSNTSQAYSPTWRDDGRFLPEDVPRFLIPTTRTGDADAEPPSFLPSLVDLEIARTSFKYFVTWCDSRAANPPACTNMDLPRTYNPNAVQGHTLYTWYGKRTWPSPSGGGDLLYSVFFPVKVFGTPEKRFFDAPDDPPQSQGWFGASSTGGSDELAAWAVAKPYGGLLGPNKLIGDDIFEAEWGEIPMNVTGGPSYPVYGAGSIQQLMEDGYFGATLSFGPGGVTAVPKNQYRARLMGLGEEPNSARGIAGNLGQPRELVGEAIGSRREPGRTDNLPPSGNIEEYLLH